MDLKISKYPFLNTFKNDLDIDTKSILEFNIPPIRIPSIRTRPNLFENSNQLVIRKTGKIAEKPHFLTHCHIKDQYSCFNFKPNDLLKEDANPKKKDVKDFETFCENSSNSKTFAVLVNTELAPTKLEDVIPKPAWKWNFELDRFQKMAIMRLENQKSVFVAAHTSAGKTVVAEYAIAMCFNRGCRVIYTSPIKALSNQKYRDFKKVFGPENVGLLTGDIKVNTECYILVMTTEILHNMLKNECKVLNDLEMVIMDEVHYLNDDSRGHIWEQLMILLPKRVQLVMLSATVHNTLHFAEWLGRIRQTQIQVITTHRRPVPLEIFLFLGCGRTQMDQWYKIMDQDKGFIDAEYSRAIKMREEHNAKITKRFNNERNKIKFPKDSQNIDEKKEDQKKKKQTHKQSKHNVVNNNAVKQQKTNKVSPETTQWLAFFEFLKSQNSLPVICFVFSRKKIQSTIDDLKSLNFIMSNKGKRYIRKFFDSIIQKKLSDEGDRKLPQVLQTREILQRGIAMHHAGMMPILKEIVEVLFSNGLVQVLFATETFAVGVNMPARTVVFDGVQKFDGVVNQKRFLKAGEFTQMAGRAGRRGLDKTGSVFILCKPGDPVYDKNVMSKIVTGQPCSLESKFKITYNMILTLFRNRVFNVKQMIRSSFIEAHRLQKYHSKESERKDVASRLSYFTNNPHICASSDCDFESINEFYDYCTRYDEFLESRKENWKHGNISTFKEGQLVLLDSRGIRELDSVLQNPDSIIEPNIRRIVPSVLIGIDYQKKMIKVLTMKCTLNRQTGEYIEKSSMKSVKPRCAYPFNTESELFINKTITEFKPQILDVCISNVYRFCDYRQANNRFSSSNTLYNQVHRVNEMKDEASYEKLLDNYGDLSKMLKCLCGENYMLPEYLKMPATGKKLFVFPEPDDKYKSVMHCPEVTSHFDFIYQYRQLSSRLDNLILELGDDTLQFLPDYLNKVKLLNDLDYIYDDSKPGFAVNETIRLKGRIACEIESHELPITELLLSGKIQHHSDPANVAATLSCLMFENKVTADAKFHTELKDNTDLIDMVNTLHKIVIDINKTMIKLNVCEEIQINYSLVDTVYLWTAGNSFAIATQGLMGVDEKMASESQGTLVEKAPSPIQLGDVIRCMQRICEALRHCESAARVMADSQLVEMFRKAKEKVYRGVVCTPSIYMDDPSAITKKASFDDDDDEEEDEDEDEDDDDKDEVNDCEGDKSDGQYDSDEEELVE